MSNPLARLLLALLLAALPAAAAPTRITLLHVNDTHSHLAPWGPKDRHLDGKLGGLPRAAAIIARERAAAGGGALFVHAGNLFHGDPLFNGTLGVAELVLLQQLGLDAMVLGNHEFQFGPEFLAGVLQATWPSGAGAVPILGTNLDLGGFPALGAWVTPTLIKEVDGVKVGFFGLTTPFDPLAIPGPVGIRDDLAAISMGAVEALRGAGAQVVVCLAHLDLELLQQLGATVPGLDVIVAGHTHVTLTRPEVLARPDGGSTYLVTAGSYYGWVGRLRLLVDGASVKLDDYRLFTVDEKTAPLAPVQEVVEALQLGVLGSLGDLYRAPVAWAESAIRNEPESACGGRDSAIGDLWTDAYRSATGAELAIEAVGFLDEGLPRGTLVGADLFRVNAYGLPVVPDDGSPAFVRPFQLATFLISGAELIKGLEIGLAMPGGLFLQVSGMRYAYDSRRPAFARVLVDSVRIGGHRLDPQRLYRMTANEGIVLFLPQLGVEVSDLAIGATSTFGAALDYLGARGELDSRTDGRIRDVAFACGCPTR